MNCISCGNSSFVKYAETSYLTLPIFKCQNCKIYVTGNSIEQIKKAISETYSKKFWDHQYEYYKVNFSKESDYIDIISQGKRRNFISQYSYLKPLIQDKKRILEVGAGTGYTTFHLDQRGYNVTGVEPDARNVSIINQKLKNSKIINANIEDFADEEKYEVIWVSHVLEHLAEPKIFLQKMKSKLEINGILFIEVPNCEHIITLNNSIISPHIWHFSKESLINVCWKTGFKIIKCDTFRPAKKIEGVLNKVFKKIINPFPYYPRILSDEKSGRDLRIVLKIMEA